MTTVDNKATAKTDNKATAMNSDFDEATQIVGTDAYPSEELTEREAVDVPSPVARGKRNSHKTIKTVGGIAVGSAVLGTAASVMMNSEDAPTGEMPDVEEEEGDENVDLLENVVELPEITVEVVRPRQNNSGTEEGLHAEENTLTAETVYADASGLKLEEADQTSPSLSVQEETISSQTIAQTEEDVFVEDIPVVSVGSAGDGDIQILGVTQDISTGYNVGHLSVDGEEVVVIDVDGDMVFDSMVTDINHDGDITADEIIDIRQQSLTLDDFGKTSDIDVNPLENSGDVPDYLSEM